MMFATVQRINRGHHGHAHSQAIGSSGLLVRGDFDRFGGAKDSPDSCFLAACDSF